MYLSFLLAVVKIDMLKADMFDEREEDMLTDDEEDGSSSGYGTFHNFASYFFGINFYFI